MKKSFTLIEILVVATIIGLLAAAAVVSYSQIMKQARDGVRKTDLEQIRAALEMYRSANDYYPSISISCNSNTAISDGTSTYLSKIPTDPKCGIYSYFYSTTGTDYTLGAYLEGSTSTCAVSVNCKGAGCNYCIGPYGEK
ncbi:hypothetical protein B6D29_04275 [Microgenomates bacterium UTCPR1]|nr:prepilin-type N-terminal cleavage/methylation domain-containing protein [Patescibacteria group bacterium]OQY65207.1 MAG: hypothetical protein B6D29_04275 [Microgenomates bacterium UTCPR1]